MLRYYCLEPSQKGDEEDMGRPHPRARGDFRGTGNTSGGNRTGSRDTRGTGAGETEDEDDGDEGDGSNAGVGGAAAAVEA